MEGILSSKVSGPSVSFTLTVRHYKFGTSWMVKPLSEIAEQGNTRDNLMVRGKRRNPSNRNQDYKASSEPNSPTTANTEYPHTPEKQDLNLKSHLIMMLEDFKKDMKNSLRETQENINKQEAYREESQKSLKEL
uniref:LRRGT00020 n=1 Tax=Rattus norvegicus TaxID=10116 RepID=Q6TXH9_RAT|nr:LRRGT00020 [Rattus norvegicus]